MIETIIILSVTYLVLGAIVTLITATVEAASNKMKGKESELSPRTQKMVDEAPSVFMLFLIALAYESIIWLPKVLVKFVKTLAVIWKHRKRG